MACPIPGERAAFLEWLTLAGYEPKPMLDLDALGRDLSAKPIEALIADVSLVPAADLPRLVKTLGSNRPLVLVGAGKALRARTGQHEETIERLARLDDISFAKTAPKGSAQIVLGETVAALPLSGVIDMGAERARLMREIEKCQAEIRKVDAKFANESFMAKAPPEIVEENRERKADFEATVKKLQVALKRVEAAA